MSNVAIDVIASFNPVGNIKPQYIRLEDENHELYIYKVESINSVKKERYSGIDSMLFQCTISIGDMQKSICIRYYVQSHKWALIRN